MKTKLTLRINKELIDNAKEYSAKSGKSISKLVADLFTMIRNEKLGEAYEITPAVKSLKGILCRIIQGVPLMLVYTKTAAGTQSVQIIFKLNKITCIFSVYPSMRHENLSVLRR